MNLLYICSINENHYRQLLKNAQLPNLDFTHSIENANIVLADPPKVAPMLKDAHQIKWLQSTFAGCDALLEQSKQDYQLTNVRGIFGASMSEYVFGQLLTLTRHLAIYRQNQAAKNWSPLPYQSLQGKTMVILGTGSIGTHLAITAKQFGMTVIGINRHAHPVCPFDKVVSSANAHLAFNDADVLVSTLPSTPDTDNFLNSQRLLCCNQALLVNVGRGNVLNTKDLLEAIAKGHIQHAVLDVFDNEPLEPSHPFWCHPAITVTPHISAQSFPEQVFAIFADNYLRWINREDFRYLIDFKQGY